jgi:hypothetical protein
MKRIVFFNGHQNGDVANSRGVVHYITENLGNSIEYYFLTLRTELGPKGAVKFNDNIIIHNPITQGLLSFMPPQWNPDIKTAHERGEVYFMYGDTLFVNVWIGSSQYYNQNRVPVGGGITRESLRMQACELIDVIREAGGPSIEYPKELDTLSTRTTNPDNKHHVEMFASKLSKFKKVVLVCNGPVMSQQSSQFSFGDILKQFIAENEQVAFVFTDRNFEASTDNCFFFNDYSPTPNLSEIDYFSSWCDVIMTRMSGPGIITMNKQNYLDPSKTLISFTLSPNIAFEALASDEEISKQQWSSPNGAKMVWTADHSEHSIVETIKTSL